MTDNLVKRLNGLAAVEGKPTAGALKEAALRIEKLEAALRRILLHSRETWECKIAKEALDAK